MRKRGRDKDKDDEDTGEEPEPDLNKVITGDYRQETKDAMAKLTEKEISFELVEVRYFFSAFCPQKYLRRQLVLFSPINL